MMCAGHEDGSKDACQGDSGGPLMTKLRQPQDNRWFLVGLVSAGYSCAVPGQPGIYHRITVSADWISYATREGEIHQILTKIWSKFDMLKAQNS
jgi:transmembrane serine protease 6